MDQKGRRVRAGSLCGLGKYKRGTVHHSAKLNEDIVRDIRRLYADGTSLSELAVKFGVNQSAIWKVATRKLWRHVI
jgi:DNA invertase Pin-like site-specific DNA recombinase